MLTLFDILSIQVVFTLLDLEPIFKDEKEDKKPVELIEALDKGQLKEFCSE